MQKHAIVSRLETEKLLREDSWAIRDHERARRSAGRSPPLQGGGPGFESQRVHADPGLKSGESDTKLTNLGLKSEA